MSDTDSPTAPSTTEDVTKNEGSMNKPRIGGVIMTLAALGLAIFGVYTIFSAVVGSLNEFHSNQQITGVINTTGASANGLTITLKEDPYQIYYLESEDSLAWSDRLTNPGTEVSITYPGRQRSYARRTILDLVITYSAPPQIGRAHV